MSSALPVRCCQVFGRQRATGMLNPTDDEPHHLLPQTIVVEQGDAEGQRHAASDESQQRLVGAPRLGVGGRRGLTQTP